MSIATEEADALARQLDANEPMVQDPVAIEFFADVATALRSVVAERDAAIARAEKAEAKAEKLRGLLWYGWNEMNAIRAMSGVPLDFHGTAQGICADYWSQVVDAMGSALGDDAKPWPSVSARAALNQGGDDGGEKAKRHHHDGIPDGLLMRGD